MYVDASEACNDLSFQLGANGIGTAVANRAWSIKVRSNSEPWTTSILKFSIVGDSVELWLLSSGTTRLYSILLWGHYRRGSNLQLWRRHPSCQSKSKHLCPSWTWQLQVSSAIQTQVVRHLTPTLFQNLLVSHSKHRLSTVWDLGFRSAIDIVVCVLWLRHNRLLHSRIRLRLYSRCQDRGQWKGQRSVSNLRP